MTDQAGKQRRSVTNALGQLIRVDEPDAGGQLGDASSPTQPTYYTYDTLNNLTTVNQGVQTRNFAYNSLSRLVSAQNPESGTIHYSYDASGNLTQKTDARGVVTAYTYDALNRVLTRTYTGETGYTTPNVSYFYDNLPHAKGRLTKVSSAVSTTEYTAFDILGRVLAAKQTTDGGDAAGYSTGYTYNLSGALIEETYPSGRVVQNTLDANGDLSKVESKRSAADFFRPYAGSFVYTAAGAVSSMRLGNGKFENTEFNSRLQPVQIGLGSSASTQNVLKLNYDYGTTDNNGNVKSQTITVAGLANPFVQSYSYDSLNRLQSATETNNGSQTWMQAFTFDRYGNRNFDEANTTTLPKECNGNTEVCEAIRPIVNPSVDITNNRLNGYTFDASGNTVRDAENRRFTYDAENKQVKVETVDGSGNPIATVGEYFYDGDGRRIKKIVPSTGEVTVFVYDAAGKQIAEYSTLVAAPQDAKVAYLTSDHLGSPRINTDQNGAVIARHDYHPFGEEVFGTAGRTTALGYTADTIRKQFTGYERDTESELDFAQARYFGSSLGRFTSPDPYSIIQESKNLCQEQGWRFLVKYLASPQNWNKYAYVVNRPYYYTDPSGRIYIRISADSIVYIKDSEYDEKAARKQFGKFTIVEEGSIIYVGSGSTGIFEPFIGQKVVLGKDGQLLPYDEAKGALIVGELGVVQSEYDPETPPIVAADTDTDVLKLFNTDVYGEARGAERNYPNGTDRSGRRDIYYGAYRHCVASCLLTKRGGSTGRLVRAGRDYFQEGNDFDSSSDLFAEDVGDFLGTSPTGSCEMMCLNAYPR